ncbi:hypothetical protein [Leptolyngbya iicbica]|uniref:Uncharacterized protein n=1 Tax=Lyngbya confervoides BDU141951 TaxID=1574623 RepID=A0A8T6QNP8_9CYAN|nr:hypothetical protein [Leptolyngbya sp. LK]
MWALLFSGDRGAGENAIAIQSSAIGDYPDVPGFEYSPRWLLLNLSC